MTLSVEQRLASIRREIETIEVNLREHWSHYNTEDKAAMRSRLSSLARQVKMLTEAERLPPRTPVQRRQYD